jgi:uncharacterized protein involved in copper resistance
MGRADLSHRLILQPSHQTNKQKHLGKAIGSGPAAGGFIQLTVTPQAVMH